MRIHELAKKCGYECFGDDCEVSSVRCASWAGRDSIAIVDDPKQVNEILANCILVHPTLMKTEKTMVFAAENLLLAACRLATVLLEHETNVSNKLFAYKNVNGYFVADNVKIGENVRIAPNAFIGRNVSIGDNCTIEPNVVIHDGVCIGDNVYISAGSSIGARSFYHYFEDGLQEFPGMGTVIVGDGVSIGCNTTIQRGTFSDTVIGERTKIGNSVDIGHDVQIGRDCKIVSQVGIAGNAVLGDHVQVYGQSGIANFVQVGSGVTVMARSGVTKNVDNNQIVSGMYARNHVEELRIQAKMQKL